MTNGERSAFRVVYYGRDKQIHKISHNYSSDRAVASAYGWLLCATVLEKPDEPSKWAAVAVEAPDCSICAFWTRRDWTRHLNRIKRAKHLEGMKVPHAIQDYADAQVRKNHRHVDPEWAQIAYEYWLYWWYAYTGTFSQREEPETVQGASE